MKKYKELHEVLKGMDNNELDRAIVIKNVHGEVFTVDNIVTIEVEFFYNKKDELSKCYTAKEMQQLGIPKEDWMLDHTSKLTQLSISKW
jgi:hypothetical protein